MRRRGAWAISVILACWLLSSCAPDVSPDTYSVGAVGQANRAVAGNIIHVRFVHIAGQSQGGAAVGAAAGAVGGSFVGGDVRSNVMGGIAGAVVGGIVGAAIQSAASRTTAWEYVVRTDVGALITVVQDGKAPLQDGERVLVLYGPKIRIVSMGR